MVYLPMGAYKMNNATSEQLKNFGKIVDTQITHSIDYSDLERFLGDIFGNNIEMLESPNDTSHTTSIEKSFEDKYTSIEDLQEIEDKMNNGNFEYYLSQVFSWLYKHKFIPEGNYIINVSW